MGQTSVDASLDQPHVFCRKEVENLVKVLMLCQGGESPEAEAHVAQERGLSLLLGRLGVQVVMDNHIIDDSLAAHGWDATKRAQHGQGPISVQRHTSRTRRWLLTDMHHMAFSSKNLQIRVNSRKYSFPIQMAMLSAIHQGCMAPPSDQQKEALLDNLYAGLSPFSASAPRSPFKASTFKEPQRATWPRKRKVDGKGKIGLDDRPLLHFQVFKDLPVLLASPTPQVTDEMRALWTVSHGNNSSHNSDEIWATHGVIGDAENNTSDVDQDANALCPALEPIVQQDVPPAPPPPPGPMLQHPTSDGSPRVLFQMMWTLRCAKP